jgi:hypothetical protein
VVRLFVICAKAELNATAEVYTLVDPMVVVQMPPGRTTEHVQEELFLYLQLSDGLGEFDVSVEMWCDHAGPEFEGVPVVRSPVVRQTFPHKLTVVEMAFRLDQVPFPKPALYEFVVRAGGEVVRGETGFIRVLPGA